MRRGLGRGRTLIAIGSVLVIVGMPLPWIAGGGEILSIETDSGFETAGVASFIAAVAMLALIVLPYTTRTRQSSLDRAIVYAALTIVGIAGVALVAISSLNPGQEGVVYRILPMDVPGLWLAAGGAVLSLWGVLELFAERPAAP